MDEKIFDLLKPVDSESDTEAKPRATPKAQKQDTANTDYYLDKQSDTMEVRSAMIRSLHSNTSSKLKQRELTHHVLATPQFLQKHFNMSENSLPLTIMSHFVECALAFATIVLCSKSIDVDDFVSQRAWQYLIASSSITFVFSLFFISRIMTYERNNGIFYCIASFCLSVAAMGVCIGSLLPNRCKNEKYCEYRRAETALTSCMAFMWLFNLASFLSLYYIPRSNYKFPVPVYLPQIVDRPVSMAAYPPEPITAQQVASAQYAQLPRVSMSQVSSPQRQRTYPRSSNSHRVARQPTVKTMS